MVKLCSFLSVSCGHGEDIKSCLLLTHQNQYFILVRKLNFQLVSLKTRLPDWLVWNKASLWILVNQD